MTSDGGLLEGILGDLVRALGAPLGAMGAAELLGRVAVLERVGRVVDAARVAVAAEVGYRSRVELGEEGLSRSENFASPVKLVVAVAGVSAREAGRRIELGRRLRAAEQLGGAVGALPFPELSGALAEGDVGVECAAIIARECGVLAARGVAPDTVREAEVALVGAARQGAGCQALPADDVARLAVRMRELLDPDGAEPRAERQQQERWLSLVRASDGMYRGRIALTPEQGALWISATQALLSPRVAPRFRSEDEIVVDQVTADTRTGPQKLVDAATDLIARAVGAPDMPHLGGATTTVNVHVSLADLEAGRGAGWIDGLTEPVPVRVVERLRCHAPVAATVFGDRGEVLHHGKARRLFSGAQNRALAARDGGCVWPGCDRPPAFCESHHVDEWRSAEHAPGRTDIDNGLLLCRFHHAHLHSSSWRLVMRGGVPHIVPPKWVDVTQTPIPVTRRRTAGIAGSPGVSPPFASEIVARAEAWLTGRSTGPPESSAA